MARKDAETFIYKVLDEITGSKENSDMYRERFAKMSDKDFKAFMHRIEEGTEHLSVIVPNFSDTIKVTTANNLKLCKKYGIKVFHKLTVGAHDGVPEHQTPNECMVIDLPVRRQSQTWSKKVRVGDGTYRIDKLTGQSAGKSTGSRMSLDEIRLLSSMGLKDSLVELTKYRGGDKKGLNAMTAMISQKGYSDMDILAPYAGRPESVHTLRSFLTAMHLKTNL